MADTFFSQLDHAVLHSLLERSALRDTPLLMVSKTMHIENFNQAASQLTDLRPLDRIDQILSEAAVLALKNCIAEHTPHTVHEELDGAYYELQCLPHREGALLAFLRDDQSRYNGSLRVLHIQGTQLLGSLLAVTDEIENPDLQMQMHKLCLRLHRILSHSDFLHDPPLTEQLHLSYRDLTSLCHEAADVAIKHGPKDGCKNITVHAPDYCEALVDLPFIREALYNLLSNALQVTPADGDISITLSESSTAFSITVADRGPGLEPALFDDLLTDWERPVSLIDYLSLTSKNMTLGLGLPLVQRIAQMHGGSLLLTPRDGGGSKLHLNIAHLPTSLAHNNLHAPMILDEGYSLEELEFSVFD